MEAYDSILQYKILKTEILFLSLICVCSCPAFHGRTDFVLNSVLTFFFKVKKYIWLLPFPLEPEE